MRISSPLRLHLLSFFRLSHSEIIRRSLVLVAILKEARQDETRVALTPDAVKALTAKGSLVAVESGAGVQSGASDQDYQDAGATISTSRAELLATADVLPVVNVLPLADQEMLKN